jgi:hypothetical protein
MDIACTRPPKPPRGSGVLTVRVYGITPTGEEYDLPPHFEVKHGDCAEIDCVCRAGAAK